MEKNKILLYLSFIALFIVSALATRFILGGPEDDWICEDGRWVAHGHPASVQPPGGCGGGVNPVTPSTGNNLTALTYQPMQCQKTPWEEWYENNKNNFTGVPSNTELISAYYAGRNIQVTDVVRIESGKAACEACSICPQAYSFSLKINGADAGKLTGEGWTGLPAEAGTEQ